jgi:hypothetical protein
LTLNLDVGGLVGAKTFVPLLLRSVLFASGAFRSAASLTRLKHPNTGRPDGLLAGT